MSEGVAPVPPAQEAAAPPDPEFEILGAEAALYSAAPMINFAGHVTEPEGREVYTIALKAQIMMEPAKRAYDPDTKKRLVELFGSPDRWATTTQPFLLAEVDLLVPAFTGATAFRIPLAASYDLELSAAKYIYSLPDGVVPLSFNFTGTIFYRAGDGRMQIVQVPWACSASFSLEVSVWREAIERHYPEGGWVALGTQTLDALAERKVELGLPTFDATVEALLNGEEK